MPVSTAAVTVAVVVPDTPASVPVIVALPHSRPYDQPAAANRRYGVRGRAPARRSAEILRTLVRKDPGRGKLQSATLGDGTICRDDHDRDQYRGCDRHGGRARHPRQSRANRCAPAALPVTRPRLGVVLLTADLKNAIPQPAQSSGPIPKAFYSTVPAEVILFDGKPVYAKTPY